MPDVIFTGLADTLAAAFWPGPLTLVLGRRADAAFTPPPPPGLPTLAVRVPDHPIAQALLRAVALPIAAPSANPSGRISPTTPGTCWTTSMDASTPCWTLAPAYEGWNPPLSISRLALPRCYAKAPSPLRDRGRHRAPGGCPCGHPCARPTRRPLCARTEAAPQRHRRRAYRGAARLRPPLPGAALTQQLSLARSPAEAAANLYAALRHLDREGTGRRLTALPPCRSPPMGWGAALNDRLSRAATR